MGRFASWVKSQDMFGHEIKLNFNRNGDAHTTVIGGLTSCIVKALIYIYIYMCAMKLFMIEDAQIETKIKNLDLDELGEVDYQDAKSSLFWVLRKTDEKQRSFFINDTDVDQYLEFSVIQWDSNWNLPVSQWHNYTKVPMRNCKLADFCFTKTDDECTDPKRI